jgi:hypothetical protein
MLKLIRGLLSPRRVDMQQRRPAPWEKYPVGSKEWVEAHYSKAGGLAVTKHDLDLLHCNREWQAEYEQFIQAMIKLRRKINALRAGLNDNQ